MSVRLADVIDVLDAAYPPRLAQDWDSVGLVCGDPAETVESVTIAVDATAAVVAEVPDRGLLLAHHPLLLRGVDTVAASTAKGALVHQMIRTGRALFTAHTNADAASPGVSDALAEALGLSVEEVLAPVPAGRRSGQVGGLRARRERRRGARGDLRRGRRSHRRLLALQLERARAPDSSCRTTARRRRSAASAPSSGCPRTGWRSSRRRACARHVLAAMRAAHPYEEPAFDIFALAPVPGDVGLGRVGSLPSPEPLSAFVSRVRDALPATSWGVRAAGDPDATVSRVAVCGGAGDSLLDTVAGAGVQAYVTADLRHHPADEHRRASDVALVDVAHWASEFPWCAQAAELLRGHFGDSLPVRVCAVRTDPWNVERSET